jgi:hypothetical protein
MAGFITNPEPGEGWRTRPRPSLNSLPATIWLGLHGETRPEATAAWCRFICSHLAGSEAGLKRRSRDLLCLPPGAGRCSSEATGNRTCPGGDGIRRGRRRGSAERQDQRRRGTSGLYECNQLLAHVNWCLLGRLPR